MTKVLVIGSGGREQALAWKLAESPKVDRVFVAPGNGGSMGKIENIDIGFTDVEALLKFAQEHTIDLTVIGQEAASDAGAVDAFRAASLTIFGPTQAATKLESSKVFSKQLMAEQHIPTAEFQAFSDAKSAAGFAKSRPFPVVIKADGLAEGKGVVICQTDQEVDAAVESIMVQKVFGNSGNNVVVEDFLKGREVSVHALCDGKQAVVFPTSQDHKQVSDGDNGPNTGGMGVIAPVPWVTTEHMATVTSQIVQPAIDGLQKQSTPFTGCLYPGLMIDGDDIKLLEFNARFGDPEAEVYMRLLDSDLYDILSACATGSLDPTAVTWKDGFAVSIALCSGGYPGKYEKGLSITGLNAAEKLEDVVVFHAATVRMADAIVTNGGRVLHVTASGHTLNAALDKAYAAVKLINFEGMHYRTDIGRRPA